MIAVRGCRRDGRVEYRDRQHHRTAGEGVDQGLVDAGLGKQSHGIAVRHHGRARRWRPASHAGKIAGPVFELLTHQHRIAHAEQRHRLGLAIASARKDVPNALQLRVACAHVCLEGAFNHGAGSRAIDGFDFRDAQPARAAASAKPATIAQPFGFQHQVLGGVVGEHDGQCDVQFGH